MKLIKQLKIADYISLFGVIPITFAIVALLSEKVFLSIIFTFCAFFVDMLDGYVARKTNSASIFGLQLDTIIDTINYPIYNALFAYLYIFQESWLGILTMIFILIFSSLRLTRMALNGICTDDKEKKYYEGVVTPHILVANILIFYVSTFVYFINPLLCSIILVPLSILMISEYKTYKPPNLTGVIFFAIILISIALYGFIKFEY